MSQPHPPVKSFPLLIPPATKERNGPYCCTVSACRMPLAFVEPGRLRCPSCGHDYAEPLDAAILRLGAAIEALNAQTPAGQIVKDLGRMLRSAASDNGPSRSEVSSDLAGGSSAPIEVHIHNGPGYEGAYVGSDGRTVYIPDPLGGPGTPVGVVMPITDDGLVKIGDAVPPAAPPNHAQAIYEGDATAHRGRAYSWLTRVWVGGLGFTADEIAEGACIALPAACNALAELEKLNYVQRTDSGAASSLLRWRPVARDETGSPPSTGPFTRPTAPAEPSVATFSVSQEPVDPAVYSNTFTAPPLTADIIRATTPLSPPKLLADPERDILRILRTFPLGMTLSGIAYNVKRPIANVRISVVALAHAGLVTSGNDDGAIVIVPPHLETAAKIAIDYWTITDKGLATLTSQGK